MRLTPRPSAERRGSPSAIVILGLANPGEQYQGSRHNVGGAAVRELAARRGVRLSSERRQRCETGTFTAPIGPVTLAVPTVFMNESGAVLPGLLRRTSLDDISRLVVAHDELDLEPGRLQLKLGGGLAGHNGLRSVAGVLKSNEFARLRIGIGKPPSRDRGSDWVLTRLTGARRVELDETVSRAADALETLVTEGFEQAQRLVNSAGRD